uniref:Uncharacterized protein n=1 Tax=Anguilla anguilla TaxID=7936 RepID=A0A0E9XS92_ANGAN
MLLTKACFLLLFLWTTCYSYRRDRLHKVLFCKKLQWFSFKKCFILNNLHHKNHNVTY